MDFKVLLKWAAVVSVIFGISFAFAMFHVIFNS
jgi:hypothetical protein